ncbi:PLD-like domain-containing protein [Friedmanniella luteola]|uniref:phospholipase D n=1 Tax=Friedmanniella luteola TaxID=546871 RepID=A0A1H1W9C6_9ACTN|nr:phospholipase D-like domain-containing protein [Friedmanniella luteola]SDS93704.1 PLD-like domain-containing protein [Friedmanniella luteola]
MRLPRPRTSWLVLACAVGLVLPTTTSTAAPPPAAPAAEAAPASVTTRLGGQQVRAHFTNPAAHGGRDRTIHDEVVRLIDGAPAGSTVRGTIYSLSVQPVARALVAAEQRGVTVLVLADGDNATSTSPAVDILEQLHSVRFCSYAPAAYGSTRRSGGACVSTSDDGDLHVKMFTFSETTDPDGLPRTDVSWFGSANLTYATGSDQFNNAVTVYGDADLASGLNHYFTDLWDRRHRPGDDYYDARSGRGYQEASSASVYASPEGAGQTDTIVARLDDVTPDPSCQIRIGMSFVTSGRPALLRFVTAARAKGCRVWLLVGSSGGAIRMPREVYKSLTSAGVSIRRVVGVHDKFFAVQGKFGGRHQYRVYTGSQNWSSGALRSNDEIFVKLAPETATAHPLYDAYVQHFGDAWATGRPCTASTFPCR